MKTRSLFILSAILINLSLQAQEKTVVINEAKGNKENLTRNMYQYPEFVNGRAFNGDGGIAEARFNYNYVTNQIEFINSKGDTLALVNGADFNRIALQRDTFYYQDKQFIQQVSHYHDYNLFVKRSLLKTNTEKKGAYDTYSGTSSITTLNDVDVGDRMVRLASDENLIYTFKDNYYLSGKFNQFYPATRKGIYDLFSKNEKKLKEFLGKNNIDFNKKEDLEHLLEYMRGIVQ